MKRVEITYTKYQKELEKLVARLERYEKSYEKKLATAQKYGVADWTAEDRNEFLRNAEATEWGFLVNKEDVKKNAAWWDLYCVKRDIEDTKNEIERAEKRFEKAMDAVDKYHAEVAQIDDLKAKEELMKIEFEQEQKEWAKDGITLVERYCGITPNGKRFAIYGNGGWTNRSWHCFTLRVDGNVIFTSGEFWRAYAYIKKH